MIALIKVRVQFRGGLLHLTDEKEPEKVVSVRRGATLAEVVAACGLALHEVLGAMSGGILKSLHDEVQDGETLELLPVVSGGD